MKMSYEAKITTCTTYINDKGKERSFINVLVDNGDDDHDGFFSKVQLFSPSYKGRDDLVGKKVRLVLKEAE